MMNFGFIVLFGLLGTFLSFMTISSLAYFFNNNGAIEFPLSTKDILLLSCVFSATDTVAVVSIVKESKYPLINSLLFGEGVMNDAASILLFKTVFSLFQTQADETVQI